MRRCNRQPAPLFPRHSSLAFVGLASPERAIVYAGDLWPRRPQAWLAGTRNVVLPYISLEDPVRTLSLVLALALASPLLASDATAQKPAVSQPVAATSSSAKSSTAKASTATRALHEHPVLVRMLEKNNALRRSLGLPPHRISPALTKAAQDHAWYMAKTGAFSHHANGGPMLRAQRYGYRNLVRENIAMGQINVDHVFSSWRSSSGHWANITSSTRDAGFGYAIGPDGSRYWVAVYGDGDNR